MKKTLTLTATLLLIVLLLFGCGAQPDGLTSATAKTAVAESTSAAHTIDLKIDYPTLPEYSEAVNKLIKDEAYLVPSEYFELGKEEPFGDITIEVKYDIKEQTPERLSISFEGYGNMVGAAHPVNMFYTVNIDVKNEKQLTLSDLTTIDDAFMDKLMASAKATLNPEIYESFNSADWYGDRANLKKTLDESDTIYYGAFSYETPDKIGVSLPVIHAMGDYVVVEVTK